MKKKRKKEKELQAENRGRASGDEGGDGQDAFWDYQQRDKRGETQETNGAAKGL